MKYYTIAFTDSTGYTSECHLISTYKECLETIKWYILNTTAIKGIITNVSDTMPDDWLDDTDYDPEDYDYELPH